MGDEITFGGVKLQRNEVVSTEEMVDREGKKHYIVLFKNGTRVAYTGGNNKNACMYEMFISKDAGIGFGAHNVTGLEYQGTTYKDYVSINNCTVLGVDVANYKNSDNTATPEDEVVVRNSQAESGVRALNGPDCNYGDGKIEADKGVDNVRLNNSDMPSIFWYDKNK